MSKFDEFVSELKQSSKGSNYSRTDLVGMATAMFNDVDLKIPVYMKKGDTYTVVEHAPGKAVRDKLIAPMVRGLGVDTAEIARLDQMQTSRAGGEALVDFALLLIKKYIAANGLSRKLVLPMTSPTETVQSISCCKQPEEARKTTMITRNEDGTYSTAPTGKMVTTAEHEKVKVGNRVPAWLKKTTDAK